MKITEYYTTRQDGVILDRTYSTLAHLLRQDGTDELYDEAIDPRDSGRSYTETDIPIVEEPTLEEKAAAYDILMGGAQDDDT